MNNSPIYNVDDITLYHLLKSLSLVEDEELDECLVLQQEQPGKKLWDLLFERGFVSKGDEEKVLHQLNKTTNFHSTPPPQGRGNSLIENPGQLVGRKVGKFEILRMVAKGGMGFVFEGIDPLLERRVAVKILSPILANNEEYRQRFIREAKLLAKIEHPNVVTVYDFGEFEDTLFIVFKFLEGKNLDDLVNEESLPTEKAIRILKGVARGLWEAHKKGIIHRDIKPSNIMIQEDGRPILTDFGIAYVDQSNLTQTGKSLGTPLYMAPEIFEGAKIDSRADIYALGVTSYFLFSKKNPFAGGTPYEIMRRQINGEYVPLREFANLPKKILNFVSKMMARHPDDRPQDLSLVLEELDALERKYCHKGSFSLSNLWEDIGDYAGGIWRPLKELFSPSTSPSGADSKEKDKESEETSFFSKEALLYGGGILLLCLIIGLGVANVLSSQSDEEKKGAIDKGITEELEGLFEKASGVYKKGKIDRALTILESNRNRVPSEMEEKWNKRIDFLERRRQQILKNFEKADQEGVQLIEGKSYDLAKNLYQDYLKYDIPQVKATLRSRISQIRRGEKNQARVVGKTSFQFLEEGKIREALLLFESSIPNKSSKSYTLWVSKLKKLYQKAQRKIEIFLKEGRYNRALTWYALFREMPLREIQSKAEKAFGEVNKIVQADLRAFLKAYQLSGGWEKQGEYGEAMEALKKYEGKISQFREICQERIKTLSELKSRLDPGVSRVYGVYREYMEKILLSGGQSYSLTRKTRPLFLEKFNVGDPLKLWIKNREVIKVEKNSRAHLIEKVRGWKKDRPINISLGKNKILGFVLHHTFTDVLLKEHETGRFVPSVKRIEWQKITKISTL